MSQRLARSRGTSWVEVCKLARQLPGVTEGISYGTPALHVGKRFLARLKEDGETMAIKIDFADREVLLELDPSAFYLTEHYRPYPAVLVRLNKAPSALVAQVLDQAWRFQAPKRILAAGQNTTRGRSTRRVARGPRSQPKRRARTA